MKNQLLLAALLLLSGCVHWPGIDNTKAPVERVPPPTATAPAPSVSPKLASAMLSSAPTYSVPVRWNSYPAPAKTIKVWLGTSPFAFTVIAQVPSSATSTTASGLKKNTGYYFRLTAIDTNSLETLPCPTVFYTRKGGQTPQAPAGSTAQ